jgi:hypothetical protein
MSPLMVIDQVIKEKDLVSNQNYLTLPTSHGGFTLAIFFIRFVPQIEILHMNGVVNAIVA